MTMNTEFDLQPILIGELLRLRPLSSEDFESLYSVASDPLIWEQHPQCDRYKIEIFRAFFEIALEGKNALIAIDQKTGKIIGSSRFYDFDPVAREIAVGFTFLARSHWGGRYNGELKSMMLNHAFRFVSSVNFHIGEHNHRSLRAIEKLGARQVARLQRSQSNGSGNFTLVYQVSRDEVDRRSVIEISADKNRLDLNTIHGFLCESYWAKGRSKTIVADCIENSFCLGLYDEQKQIGFLRAVTDKTIFGYLFDVFVMDEYRGKGYGKALISTLLELPKFRNVKWMLRTTDAGAFYEKLGFQRMTSGEGFYLRSANQPCGNR